jgi:CRP-like cAMP-binding protein
MPKSGASLMPSPKPKIFEGLGSSELREILEFAQARKMAPRKVIFVAGDPAAHFFLLLSGHVHFYRLSREGDRIPLTQLTKGDVFGLGALLPRRMQYVGTAETKSDCEFLVWDQARVRKLAQRYPRLAENALGIILQYLAAHVDRLVDLMTLNAAERLARVVFHLGKQIGKIVPNGIEIEATNAELSELANISLFTASRLLNKWARAGILTRSRGRIFLYSPEALLT